MYSDILSNSRICSIQAATIFFTKSPSSNSSFKKLSIVSTPLNQGCLALSDFALKSANMSANIEPFKRLCSNRWDFHIKNHPKPVEQYTIDNFLKELFINILFLDIVLFQVLQHLFSNLIHSGNSLVYSLNNVHLLYSML